MPDNIYMPFHFETLGSTQVFLKEQLLADPTLPHLECVLADQQTDGLGRHGRSWISEKGNLFLSVYLKQHSLPLTWIPHWIAVVLTECLEEMGASSSSIQLKWPNDLIVNGHQKLAGILCEKVESGIVVGIGVNLVSSPELSDRGTTSLSALVPKLESQGLNEKLCRSILKHLSKEPSLTDLKMLYLAHSILKMGDQIHWMDLQTKAKGEGTFIRYGDFGEIWALENGKERALYSEEIKLSLEQAK
jgi:biotin-[acetyl-CoA-carboxylase] ligase BirA-like protein